MIIAMFVFYDIQCKTNFNYCIKLGSFLIYSLNNHDFLSLKHKLSETPWK